MVTAVTSTKRTHNSEAPAASRTYNHHEVIAATVVEASPLKKQRVTRASTSEMAPKIEAISARVLFSRTPKGHRVEKVRNVNKAIYEINEKIERNPLNRIFLNNPIFETNSSFSDTLIDDLSQILKLNPSHSISYFRRAKAYLCLTKFHPEYLEMAKQDIEMGNRLSPENAEVHYLRALSFCITEEIPKALMNLDLYDQVNPNNLGSLFLRGCLLTHEEDSSKAIEAFTQCLILDTTHVQSMLRLSEIYYHMNKPLALEYASKAIELKPLERIALMARSEIYRDQGKLIEASIDITRAIQVCEECAYSWAILADIYIRAGDPRALEYATNALELNPKERLALEVRGKCYFEQKEFALGLADLSKIQDSSFWIDAISYITNKTKKHFEEKSFGKAIFYHSLLIPYFETETLINHQLEAASRSSATTRSDHRLSPLFQDLEQLREILSPGAVKQTTLSPRDKGLITQEGAHDYTTHESQYEYILKLLISFQELDLNKTEINALNNKKEFPLNLGDRLAFAVSGIILHSDENRELEDPIGQFMDTLIATYNKAKENGRLLDFFQNAFNRRNDCFGGKGTTLNEYSACQELDLETVADVDPLCLPLTNAGAFYRAFRASQIKDMARKLGLPAKQLRTDILLGPESVIQESFYAEYCTEAKFRKYLEDYPATQEIIDCIPEMRDGGLL